MTKKFTDLTELTTGAASDIFAIVDDVGGAGEESKKIRLDNLFGSPQPIGSTTPSTGAFTNLDATGDIDFSSASSLSLPTGTWTPAFIGVTVTYTDQTGRYVKVGDVVYFEFSITYNTLDTSDVSAIVLGTLPFSQGNNGFAQGVIDRSSSTGLTFGTTGIPQLNGSASNGTRLNLSDDTGAFLNYNSSGVNASGVLKGSGWYLV